MAACQSISPLSGPSLPIFFKLELVRAQLQGVANGFVHKGLLSTTKGCLLTDTLELRSLGSKEGMCNASHSIDP